MDKKSPVAGVKAGPFFIIKSFFSVSHGSQLNQFKVYLKSFSLKLLKLFDERMRLSSPQLSHPPSQRLPKIFQDEVDST